MKKLNNILLGITLSASILTGCKSHSTNSLSEADIQKYALLGDSISVEIQAVLLGNVAKAMQEGGPDFAVDFCHTRAAHLTDSVSQAVVAYIQRLSDKNRNPDNAIQTEADKLAWARIKSEPSGFVEQSIDGDIFFYKAIGTGMPTCLKCHGRDKDIAASTLNIIQQKYPNDKATGYELGDLRGMWKIKLN